LIVGQYEYTASRHKTVVFGPLQKTLIIVIKMVLF